MEFLEAPNLPSVGQRHGLAEVSRAVPVKKNSQATPANLQGQIPQALLDFMKRPAFSQRGREQVKNLRDDFLGQFRLENAEGFRNVHKHTSVRVKSISSCQLIRRGALWLGSQEQQPASISRLAQKRSGGYAQPR